MSDRNGGSLEKGKRVRGMRDSSTILFSMPSAFAMESLFYFSHIGEVHGIPGEYSIERRRFDSFLLIVLHEGALKVKTGKQFYRAAPGDLVLLDCYEPHAYKALNNVRFSFFHFDGLSSRGYFQLLHNRFGTIIPVRDLNVENRLVVYFEELIKIAGSPLKDEHQISLKIHTILTALAGCEEEAGHASRENIRRAVSFIEQHLSEDISVNDIAGHVGLDVSYFSRVFKKRLSSTPHVYLNNRRIAYAKELLWATDLPVEIIAEKCGFRHPTSFYRAFRRMTGYSPSHFRKL